MKNIITSLFVYKSNLYLSYLNGKIVQQHVDTKYKKSESISFTPIFDFDNTIVLDIKAYKNRFYILTRDGLYEYHNQLTKKIKEISDAQVIAIDSVLKILFIVSDTRGLIGINLRNNRFIDDINLDIFNKTGDDENIVSITSIVASAGVIFLSILNAGIFRIDYKKKEFSFKYKTLHKLEIKNPQDIFFNEKEKQLVIVDFDYGLVIINIENENTNNYRLPNDDIPNTVKLVKTYNKTYYVIQARNGLYKFDPGNEEFIKIREERTSNLTTYFNKLFFTQKGQLNTIDI